MKQEKTFKLEQLDKEFWDKVILIQVIRSNGFLGWGYLWLFTSDVKAYFIGFEGFPYSENNLGEFTPLLKRKKKIKDCDHLFEAEDNGWTYVPEERALVRNDIYDSFIKEYNREKGDIKGKIVFTPVTVIAARALGAEDKLERIDEENTALVREKSIKENLEREEKQKRIALTEEDFVWQKIYPNNISNTSWCWGEYALIFKEYEGKVVGHKFSIVYQKEEISPLHGKLNASIERYNLFELRYDDVQGYLTVGKGGREFFGEAFDYDHTLSNDSVNSFGDFIRSFATPEEAKEYAIEVSNIREYANKENIIKDLDNDERMYKNWLRKYSAIVEFRKHYAEIFKIVCEYEYPSNTCSGGEFITAEIKDKLGFSDELMREMWQYVPLELTKRTQEKAERMVGECKEFLKLR